MLIFLEDYLIKLILKNQNYCFFGFFLEEYYFLLKGKTVAK
ncbi:hypothetical protein EU99_1651 [Prochlorococcus marinus str. MIT 9321]|uniref:Uncharacterized protein n=1 Tax=Prochlorococcus marinus str. MIT 9401 TaxID=167551 RepID=A0A0A2BCL5_PROMR|nr:hypothetical protein EU99_1651 [Prochlorococcus marinus str. MIT 9321]KGG05323.1 hypothetical protein EV00_0957 [Prochlorococcus marinus str. MIT 9322]KGG10384.1 hypothetical protein EV01_0287 [Prochlorococcus marinus str. MIT 9401]